MDHHGGIKEDGERTDYRTKLPYGCTTCVVEYVDQESVCTGASTPTEYTIPHPSSFDSDLHTRSRGIATERENKAKIFR